MTAPHKEIAIIGCAHFDRRFGYIIPSRKRPQAPSFKRILARIIDPATGASTWAFGSHRWVKYIGSFTKNAMSKAISM